MNADDSDVFGRDEGILEQGEAVAVFIGFPDGSAWNVTNREFNRLIMRHARFFPSEEEIREKLRVIAGVGFVLLREEDSHGKAILATLRDLAARVIALADEKSDEARALEIDDDTARIYRSLLDLILKNGCRSISQPNN